MSKPRITWKQLPEFLAEPKPFTGNSWEGSWTTGKDGHDEFVITVEMFDEATQTDQNVVVARARCQLGNRPRGTYFIPGEWHKYMGDGGTLTFTQVRMRNAAQRVWK